MDELPSGGLNIDEDSEEAAGRELQEETGYVAGKVEFFGKVYEDVYNNCSWFYYFTTDFTLPTEG